MPRYCFDLIDAKTLMPDRFGAELADDDEVRDQALALLPDIAGRAVPDRDRHEFAAKVRNARGVVVYEASLILDGRWCPSRRG